MRIQSINSSATQEWTPELVTYLREQSQVLGFTSLGICSLNMEVPAKGLKAWLEAGYHGSMDYMARHASLRERPSELVPGAKSAVMVTMNYNQASLDRLLEPDAAVLASYAWGRDYHKIVRGQLKLLADKLFAAPAFSSSDQSRQGFRVFCDSAPVMEVELAQRAGLGWRGKNTLLLHRNQGSLFFIGTFYTSLDMPNGNLASANSATEDVHATEHCGTCTKCLDVCPTQAFDAPYRLDARKCISYLTIEHKGSIPAEYRHAIGNRIYGCDDCQLVCPWNKFAQQALHPDFATRHRLDSSTLLELFAWNEQEWDVKMAGSAIYRIGYWQWIRNIAVAIGNALRGNALKGNATHQTKDARLYRLALMQKMQSCNLNHLDQAIAHEHIQWALAQESS